MLRFYSLKPSSGKKEMKDAPPRPVVSFILFAFFCSPAFSQIPAPEAQRRVPVKVPAAQSIFKEKTVLTELPFIITMSIKGFAAAEFTFSAFHRKEIRRF
jgi:hypothetical protein